MTSSNKLGFTLFQTGVDGTTIGNDALLRLENALCIHALGTWQGNTPGTATLGNTYVLGSSPTGAWAGHANQIAIGDGTNWVFISPSPSMIAWSVTDKVRYAYDANEGLWYPLQPIWSTTEHWTGKYRDTIKVWSKVVDFGALPNATSKSVAHSISPLLLTYKRAPMVEGVVSNGTNAYSIGQAAQVLGLTECRMDSTNVVITCTTNLTAYSAFLRLEYCKS